MRSVSVNVTIQFDLPDQDLAATTEAKKQGYIFQDDGMLWKGEDMQSIDSFKPSVLEVVNDQLESINNTLANSGLLSCPQILTGSIDDDDIQLLPSEEDEEETSN